MGESHLGWVFSEIGTPSGLGMRREERERESSWIVVWTPILGWLECGWDRGSNDENLL